MRNFSSDSPQFMAFTIGDSKEEYRLPLAASLPLNESIRFADISAIADEDARNAAALRFQYDLVVKYLGEGVADVITTAQMGEIFAAWVEESQAQGASAGE